MTLLQSILRIYHRTTNIFDKDKRIFLTIKLIVLLVVHSIKEGIVRILAVDNTKEGIDSLVVGNIKGDIANIPMEFIDPQGDSIEEDIAIDPANDIVPFVVGIADIVDAVKVIVLLVALLHILPDEFEDSHDEELELAVVEWLEAELGLVNGLELAFVDVEYVLLEDNTEHFVYSIEDQQLVEAVRANEDALEEHYGAYVAVDDEEGEKHEFAEQYDFEED